MTFSNMPMGTMARCEPLVVVVKSYFGGKNPDETVVEKMFPPGFNQPKNSRSRFSLRTLTACDSDRGTRLLRPSRCGR